MSEFGEPPPRVPGVHTRLPTNTTPPTPQGEKLRKKGFSLADPNGNGLCSLAEIEGFIKGTLSATYPKQVITSMY